MIAFLRKKIRLSGLWDECGLKEKVGSFTYSISYSVFKEYIVHIILGIRDFPRLTIYIEHSVCWL